MPHLSADKAAKFSSPLRAPTTTTTPPVKARQKGFHSIRKVPMKSFIFEKVIKDLKTRETSERKIIKKVLWWKEVKMEAITIII